MNLGSKSPVTFRALVRSLSGVSSVVLLEVTDFSERCGTHVALMRSCDIVAVVDLLIFRLYLSDADLVARVRYEQRFFENDRRC